MSQKSVPNLRAAKDSEEFPSRAEADVAPNPFTVSLEIGVLPLFFLGYKEVSVEDFPGLDLRQSRMRVEMSKGRRATDPPQPLPDHSNLKALFWNNLKV